MDTLLSVLPVQIVPYVSIAIAVSAALATVLPPPAQKTGGYATFYAVVNWIGLNVGHAKNSEDTTPKS